MISSHPKWATCTLLVANKSPQTRHTSSSTAKRIRSNVKHLTAQIFTKFPSPPEIDGCG